MKFKILVLDLDGTLTNTKKEVSPRTREVVIRAQEQGIRLVLASGRPTFGITPLANELQMNRFGGYILAYNGGEIIDWKSKEIIYHNVLPDVVIPYLYNCARQNELAILSYNDENIITESPEDIYVEKEAFLNKMAIRATADFLADLRLPVPKCLIVGNPSRLITVESEISLRLQGKIKVYRSEPYFLELVPPGIDKAQSLAILLERLNLTSEEIVAIGDGYNDLSMIEFAGMGVAMANAQAVVKRAADYITLSNDEDGVAEVVEQFLLNETNK